MLIDDDRPSDIEVAMNFSQLLDANIEVMKTHRTNNLISFYAKMAENAMVSMTNPFAKKLILDKIDTTKELISPSAGYLF